MPVSDWSREVLSTMDSILKLEREVQKLCGLKTTFRINPLADGEKYQIEIFGIDIGDLTAIDRPYLKVTPLEAQLLGLATHGNIETYDTGEHSELAVINSVDLLPVELLSSDRQLEKLNLVIQMQLHVVVEQTGQYVTIQWDVDNTLDCYFAEIDFTDDKLWREKDGKTYRAQWQLYATGDFAIYSADIESQIEAWYIANPGEPLPPDLEAYSRLSFADLWGDAIDHLILRATTTPYEDVTAAGNWNDKIAIAKQVLGFDLEKKLTDQGIKVDESTGQVLLNVINNPQTFALCSDYKVIQLIYQDLSETSLNAELYAKKAEHYERLYRDELYKAWLRVNLDTSLTGTVNEYRSNMIGELER